MYRYFSRFKSESSENKCEHHPMVPLYKKTYFLIETSDADLEVEYKFVGKIILNNLLKRNQMY